ncbi:Shedu immune nuclease family protein [Rosistilla oblonga]|uniref:Shedu immune nuclease family protein n=1 Tax=Rosistilla oblonga TaxID=2527990 RepID=UPI003A96FE66
MADDITEKFNDDGELIYRIDRKKKTGVYNLTEGETQHKFVKQIKLDGFSTFPKVLYPQGYGLRVSGTQLLEMLHRKFGDKLRLILSASKPAAVRRTSTTVVVTINEVSLRTANVGVSDVKKAKATEIKVLVHDFLKHQLPAHFKGKLDGAFGYRPNRIAEMLEDPDVREHLSDKDVLAIQGIYPELLGEIPFTLRSAAKVKMVTEGIKASKRVYLNQTIKDFEKKLKGNSSESVWQKFLHEHILTLLNTYAFVIEKQSVELGGKFPDFMLIDAYGYLDVYEIKKPQTTLLKYDKSRDNYYWDAELARAITQTEKYMSSVLRHRYELEHKFRKKQMEAHIVRPRGFIIAGRRADLKDDTMREDFRILNDSLKNVDVICFDDLLDNLTTLRDRLAEDVNGAKKK